jgi:hypothetical protein
VYSNIENNILPELLESVGSSKGEGVVGALPVAQRDGDVILGSLARDSSELSYPVTSSPALEERFP